ncbi:MAG: protein translocase subunit SecD, partial [Anaerolineales bacterium]
MQQRYTAWLIPILLLVLGAIYVAIPGTGIPAIGNLPAQNFTVHQGLDLQGGLQVLLVADLPPGQSPDSRSMQVARQIIEQRVNALGLAEPLVQVQGNNRIVVELPGIENPQEAIDTLKQTGLLEFVHVNTQPPPDGTIIQTDCVDPSRVDCGASSGTTPSPTGETPATTSPTTEPTSASTSAPTGEATAAGPATAGATATAAPTEAATPTGPVYHTVMTGVALRDAVVVRDPTTGEWQISFTLTDEGSRIFGDFTSQHIGEFLAIVLDKQIISAPLIEGAITGGTGQISGSFTQQSANQLALQLRYGALPVPLKVDTSREVGATLGQDSVRKSTVAGVIGLAAVALFMLLYYRLPGAVAVVALLIYAVVTFALFKLIPVTLTLPGIAGFILSVGVAVDANILIFERMKEELRGGRNLRSAVDTGFS